MQTVVVVANELITVDIPDNHASLLRRQNELQMERVALKKRLTTTNRGATTTYIAKELSVIKAELEIINKKLRQFQQAKSPRKKLKERQREMVAKGLQPFPSGGTDADRYDWAAGLLHHAVKVMEENKVSDKRLENFITALKAISHWEKHQLEEAIAAKELIEQKEVA